MDLTAAGRVRRLPDDLVNKIAAGEVVERPASVVKELIENALDAGARTIQVEIEAGGKSLIRVRDDGQGMGREDARLALERHATSKLAALSDLEAIATHGFRGEALPSIASVSHLLLRTRTEAHPAGTEIEVRHGRVVQVRDAGHPRGTTVEVRDLFGDVPARRKFLRADGTEAAHVAEAVVLLALARPTTGFFLISGRRRVVEAPPVDGLRARLYQLYGSGLLEDLVSVEGGQGWIQVRGFVSRPDRPTPPRAAVRLFVNVRPVRDRGLSRAVIEAYRAAGAGDRRPEAFLFLEAPLHLVDVNVHPAKTEVRFADPRTAWAAVQASVSEALSAGARDRPPRADTARVEEAVERYVATPRPGEGRPWSGGVPQHLPLGEEGPGERAPRPALSVLGQHRATYIVASDGEDLVLVDQHTAHERVRYEGLLDGLARRNVASQGLLGAVVVPMPPDLLALVEDHAETLEALGFEIEGFGGGSLRIRSVPAVLAGRDPGRTLEALLVDFREREGAGWAVSGPRDRLAATIACHSSVRAGEALPRESMSAIVEALGRTAHPTLCPHGRPTSVRIPREDVSRWFGRSGWKRS